MKAVLIALVVCLSVPAVPAVADPDPAPPVGAQPVPVPLKGLFAFDWFKIKKSKCAEIKGALLTRIKKSYDCTPPDDANASASGKPIVATCQARKAKSEYVVFATKADCVEERETQLANGD
jgi:hypothetical protein